MTYRIVGSLVVLAVLAALLVLGQDTTPTTAPAAPSSLTPDDSSMKGLKIE